MHDTNGLGDGAGRSGDDVWTALRRLEQRLAEEQRAREQAEATALEKERYVAALAKALRKPLSSISGWLQIIGSGKAEPAEKQAAIASLTRNVRTLLGIVDDIASHACAEPTVARRDFVTVDLGQMLAQLIQEYRPLAVHRSIRLQASIARSKLQGDPHHLRLALDNLLHHALRFAASGGDVLVTTRCDGESILIMIRDSSRAVCSQLPPHAFERAGPSSLALGLRLARRYVESHGGVVSTRDTQPDGAAVLTIRLPLAQHAASS